MSVKNFKRADEINVQVSRDNLPTGWEKTHQEYRKPIRDGLGYYIHQYESEHFLVDMTIDSRSIGSRNKETVHHISLLKIKRGDDGEMLTCIGTGIFHIVGVEDGRQAFSDGAENVDWDDNKQAHEEAEKAAFQLAFNLMKEVNNGDYKHKRYSE